MSLFPRINFRAQHSGSALFSVVFIVTLILPTLLTSTFSVNDGGNGRLVIGQTTFVEVAPWVFHQVDGPETVVFRTDHNGMLMLIGSFPTVAYIKVAWYDAPTFHLVLVVACALLFLSALLLWPLGFVRKAMRRGAALPKSGRKADLEGAQAASPDEQGKHIGKRMGLLPFLASWLAGVLCALNVFFLIGLGLIVSNAADLAFGVTPLLTTLFALALVSAALTVGVVVFTILAWWGPSGAQGGASTTAWWPWPRWRSPGNWSTGTCSDFAAETYFHFTRSNPPDLADRK